MKKTQITMVVGAAALLAVLGLVFCWYCPDRLHPVADGTWPYAFRLQVVYNLFGLLFFGAAIYVGWHRWMKVAPWGSALGLAVPLISVRLLDRFQSWSIVSVKVEILSVMFVSLLLLVAWLTHKFHVKMRMLLLSMLGLLLVLLTINFLSRPFSVENLMTLANSGYPAIPQEAQGWVQRRLCAAMAASNWWSGSNLGVDYLPHCLGAGAPAAISLVFGKWYLVVAFLLFAVLYVGTLFYCAKADWDKFRYSVLLGTMLSSLAIWDFLHCAGVSSYFPVGMPWVSLGGSVMVYWFALGVFVSGVLDKDCRENEKFHFDSDVWLIAFKVTLVAIVSLTVFALARSALVKADVYSDDRPDDVVIPRQAWL